MDRERCLQGVGVVEYGTGIGVRFCGQLLVQLGADVRRLEQDRSLPPTPEAALRERAAAAYLDRGKIQLSGGLDGNEFEQAVRAADIVVRGADPVGVHTATQLRAEYERSRVLNRSVVFVSLTPFGVRGELGSLGGSDLNAQGLSGWVSIIGNPDESPLGMAYGIGAMQQGLSAAGAAVAALLARDEEPRAEFVDISETQVVTASIRQYAIIYRWGRIPLRRSGRRAPGSSGRYPHTVWPCKDGEVMIILRSEVEWNRLIEMLGEPMWAQEPRYRDFYAMGREYPDEVDALIVPWMLERTKAEIGALAQLHAVPMAPIATVDEVLSDEQMLARDFFTETKFDDQTLVLPGLAAKFRRARCATDGAAPEDQNPGEQAG